jgi:hypothetical protein
MDVGIATQCCTDSQYLDSVFAYGLGMVHFWLEVRTSSYMGGQTSISSTWSNINRLSLLSCERRPFSHDILDLPFSAGETFILDHCDLRKPTLGTKSDHVSIAAAARLLS